MPLYDFKCCKCDNEFEENVKLESIDKNVKVKCPKCSGSSKRLITNPKHYKHLSWSSWNINK